MQKVFIISAKRTAIGMNQGSLKDVSCGEMGSTVVRSIFEETHITPGIVDEVIVGNVLSAGQGQGVARQVALKAGIPNTVCAYGINMVCGSGMKAIMNATASISNGDSHIIIAGGVENMSNAPYLLPGKVRTGNKMGSFETLDHMIHDALRDAFSGNHMGITAENIAEKYEISREEQDEFAINSQQKAQKAIEKNKFKEEIVPISVKINRKNIIFEKDEYPNFELTLEKLSTMRTAFIKNGTVTAGNSSGINDGASFVLLASEKACDKYNLTPLCEVIGYAQGGVDPDFMGLGPVIAIDKLIEKHNLELNDIDLFELNEAFAAQSIGVLNLLIEKHKLNKNELLSKVNVNGGAIALGHPVGASGCRIVTSLVHEMKKNSAKKGIASLCIGGGMGTALLLQNID
jgi:acetyl-CoA C-acetyltransferase